MNNNTKPVISIEDSESEDALILIKKLSKELTIRYEDDDEGTGAFTPADVKVDRAAFVIARVDGNAVGCGALRPCDVNEYGNTCEVKRMFVDTHMRGRGISKLILAKLEEIAKEFSYDRVILETGKLQPEAIGLYEKSGYKRIPNYGKYVDRQLSVCYEKVLNSL